MSDWRVLGAGAMGCLWAGYLYKTGHQVELLLKDQAVMSRYRKASGVTLISDNSREKLPLNASITEHGQTIDLLLITTKAHQTMAAMEAVSSRLADNCNMLLLQNGMGVAAKIAEKFPGKNLFCGVTTDGAYCPEEFSVIHAGVGDTHIGSYRNTNDPQKLAEKLPGQFLNINVCDDIEDRQWKKLAVNCAVNGLTVIFQCRNGEILNNEKSKLRLVKLCEEIAAVGSALGYTDWTDNLYATTESVIKMTANNYSSMYQDISNRRATEIDFINGYLIEQAGQLGIDCPENLRLFREIKQKEESLGCGM